VIYISHAFDVFCHPVLLSEPSAMDYVIVFSVGLCYS